MYGQRIHPETETAWQRRLAAARVIVGHDVKAGLHQCPQIAMPGVGRVGESVNQKHGFSNTGLDHPQPVRADGRAVYPRFGLQKLLPLRIAGH